MPCVPVGNSLRLDKSGPNLTLTWSGVLCADLAGYRVEAGTTPSLPGMTVLLTVPTTTATDPLNAPWSFYHIRDVDSCGTPSVH